MHQDSLEPAEDLKKVHRSKPGIPLLADVCFKAGYIEAWGRGTVRIIEACKDAAAKTGRIPSPSIGQKAGKAGIFLK